MEKIYCLFSVLLLSGLVGVNSLQCYTCFKCTTLGADDLRTCGEPVTTLPPTVPTTTGIPTSPTTTTPSTTIPSTTTPSTTTASTTTPSTTIPSTTTPSTTIPSTTTTSTTTSTTTTSTTETPVDPPVDPPVGPEPEVRSKRNVVSPASASSVSQFEDIEYVCYKVTAIVNNETVIERGCAPAVKNEELCENEIIKNVTTSCSSCKTDKCNGSYAVQFSTALLAAAVVGLLFCK